MTRPKVMVVDDQPDFVDMVRAMLEPAGYDVLGCTRAAEARHSIVKQRPDLVLLDLMMPGLSGFDVIHILDADPATRRIPVILTTAAADLIAKNLPILEAKGLTVLAKPFSLDDLLSKIREAVARAKS